MDIRTIMDELSIYLTQTFGRNCPEIEAGPCPAEFDGEWAIDCFLLARSLQHSPIQIAKCISEFLSNHEHVAYVCNLKAFVSIALK